MNSCIRCGQSIVLGKEVWMRRKSNDERVPVCPQCAQEVRQTTRSRQERQATKSAKHSKQLQARRKAASGSKARPDVSQNAVASRVKPGRVSIEGLLILTLMVIIGAPLLGGLVALVSRFLYLIIVFPLGIGVLGGLIVAQSIRFGKVRVSLVGVIFGLLLGLCVYGSYRYTEYLLNRKDALAYIMEEMEAEFGEADTATAAEVFDVILYEETGKTGFWGSVLLDAKEGMSIKRRPYSPNSYNIGTTLTWIYWLFEMAAITGLPAFFGAEEATKPFCEYHNRWYEREKSLGGIGPSYAREVINLLEAGDYTLFGKSLNQKTPVPGVEFYIERCPNCKESFPILTIKTVKRTEKGKLRHSVLSQKTITPVQSEQILAGMHSQQHKS